MNILDYIEQSQNIKNTRIKQSDIIGQKFTINDIEVKHFIDHKAYLLCTNLGEFYAGAHFVKFFNNFMRECDETLYDAIDDFKDTIWTIEPRTSEDGLTWYFYKLEAQDMYDRDKARNEANDI